MVTLHSWIAGLLNVLLGHGLSVWADRMIEGRIEDGATPREPDARPGAAGRTGDARTGAGVRARIALADLAIVLLTVLTLGRHGSSWITWAALPVSTLLVVCSYTDLRARIIPDRVNALGYLIAAGAVLVTWISSGRTPLVEPSPIIQDVPYEYVSAAFTPRAALEGFLTGAGLLYLVGAIGATTFQTLAIGGGDVKMAGWIGILLGARGTLTCLAIAVILALPVSAFQTVRGRMAGRTGPTYFPMGPFIAGAALVVIHLGVQRSLDVFTVVRIPWR